MGLTVYLSVHIFVNSCFLAGKDIHIVFPSFPGIFSWEGELVLCFTTYNERLVLQTMRFRTKNFEGFNIIYADDAEVQQITDAYGYIEKITYNIDLQNANDLDLQP